MQVDKHFTSIDIRTRWYKNDPFVLPIQVQQQFQSNGVSQVVEGGEYMSSTLAREALEPEVLDQNTSNGIRQREFHVDEDEETDNEDNYISDDIDEDGEENIDDDKDNT
ncbi:hypothetical protein Salat_1889800 [Sesamum alatum]|uniref:Uncharacterized protein n=1 Tax=Sesamum alatum TaxID=300844 RepID=A0AAE1Y4B2_9LAMI|nr:hypothetical protein Salat_1889800 [Sesamum alatum]